jgi:Uma2 family endonuclease
MRLRKSARTQSSGDFEHQSWHTHRNRYDRPADICIEVISDESVIRDYGDKFAEYEKAGVREYWVIDPIRSVCHFYRLNEAKVYEHHLAGDADNYQTPLLLGLLVHVPTLWQETLPNFFAIGETVQAMVK